MKTSDEMTELVDAQIDRVDLVGAPANGRAFLIRKAAADGLLQPLVPAEMVEALVAKAEQPTDEVAKTDSPVEVADLRDENPGGSAESLPGSPDWESHDAETALAAVAVLGRVAAVLGWLAEREATEAIAGNDDGEAAWDLSDMASQVDCLINRLGGFAAGEQVAADLAEELDAIGKALAPVGGGDLRVLEALAPVAKAGRTLSAANEAAIRGAVDSLSGVLASLPAAPAAEAPVAKTEAPEPVAVESPLAGLLKSARRLTPLTVTEALLAGGRSVDVSKAKGEPQMAVFDETGKLVGVIDPADLAPIAPAAAPAVEDAPAADAPAEDAAAPVEEAAADPASAPADPASAPAAPAEADARTIPGTDTVQAPAQTPAQDPADDDKVAKAVSAGLAEALAPFAEQIAQFAHLAKAHADLKEHVAKLAATPDDRNSPRLHGALSAGPMSRDGQAVDAFADLRKSVDEAKSESEKRDALQRLAFAQTKARFTR